MNDLEKRLRDFGNNIEIKKLNLKSHFIKKRKISYIPILTSLLSLFLVVTVFAAETDFFKFWKTNSEVTIKEFEDIVSRGYGETYNIVREDENIRITLESVIADDLNTLLLFKIENLKGDDKYTMDIFGVEQNIIVAGDILDSVMDEMGAFDTRNNLILGPDEEKIISMQVIRNFKNLYIEDKGQSKVLLTLAPMEKEKGSIDLEIKKLKNLTEMHDGKSSEIRNDIEGIWDFNIDVNKEKTKEYIVDLEYTFDGYDLKVDKILLTPTGTKLDYTYEYYNRQNKSYLENIDFNLSRFFTEYESSNIAFASETINQGSNIVRSSFVFSEMYDKNPRWINLNIKKIKYRNKGQEKYDIDWNDLPQKIDYNGSEITVNKLSYEDGLAIVNILEDKSIDRKYVVSNIEIETINNPSTYTMGKYIKGHNKYRNQREIKNDLDYFNMDYMDSIYYVDKQNLYVENHSNRMVSYLEYEVNDYTDEIILGKLYVKNQEFEKFLNNRFRIRLK